MRKKIYGANKQETCFLCGSISTALNDEGLPVCVCHRKEKGNFRCVCKEWLDVKKSKYGVFFTCINCGVISYSKGLKMNDMPLKAINNI